MKLRQFSVRTFGVAAIGAAVAMAAAPGTASAAPTPAPALWYFGTATVALGQNSWCNGVIDAAVTIDPAVPRHATVSLTSRGMHGVGPEWSRNPVCPISFTVSWGDGVFPFRHDKQMPLLLAGEAPGQTVRTDIDPGSGLIAMGINATPLSAPLGGYFLMP